MKFHPTPLSGLWEIETQALGDMRGHFTRIFCDTSLSCMRSGLRFVQSNLSFTAQQGTVRGMHFQRSPAAEAKLIRCIRGAVFDVAVDLRAGSATYGQWHGLTLSADNHRQVFIPEGFAHGFQTLTDNVELLYQHTTAYTPQCEGGVKHNDPQIGIQWPLPITLVSPRDQQLPPLSRAFTGVPA